ncbi:uncharacterized protein LOC127846949 isoform X3 [Dreissena polymorpha]|uniref:uncharacterized protein LOC127846949 isoform X3 n=1 Tax=Dreissena polymorpha TaxID=45954 RepID=UPI0022648551|nr:uncharacterized protein LOC127846949 isoform X3 [Dreissena polymorpha]
MDKTNSCFSRSCTRYLNEIHVACGLSFAYVHHLKQTSHTTLNKEEKLPCNTIRAPTDKKHECGDIETGNFGTPHGGTQTLNGHNDHEEYQEHTENKSQLKSDCHLINEIDTTADLKTGNGWKSQAGSDFAKKAESMNNIGPQEAKEDNKTYHEQFSVEVHTQRSADNEMKFDTPTSSSREETLEQEVSVGNTPTPDNETTLDDKESFNENSINKQNLDLVKTTEDYIKSADNTDDEDTTSQHALSAKPQSETYNNTRDQTESSIVFGATIPKDPLRKDEDLKMSRNEIASPSFQDADNNADNIDDAATTGQQVWLVQTQSQSDANNDTPDQGKGSNDFRTTQQKDPLRKMDNLKFYRNEIASRPFPGSYVEDMLAWEGDYKKLESSHSYIQWLFPIPGSSGLNYSAQELFDYEAKEIIEDSVAHARVLRAYKMMLNFYGMKLEDETSGEIRRCEENWKDRYAHLNTSYHNYMRITRILTSLAQMGYERFQQPLVRFILAEAIVNKTLPNLNSSSMDYWIEAIKDGDEMFAMIKLRQEMQKNTKNFDQYGYPFTSEQPSNIMASVDALLAVELQTKGTIINIKADNVEQYGNQTASDPLSSSQTDGVAERPPGDVDPEIDIDPPRTISKEDASSGNHEIQACQTVQTPLVVLGQEACSNHENEAQTGDEIQRGQRDVMDKESDYTVTESGFLLQPGNIQQEALTVAQAPEKEFKEDQTDGNVNKDIHDKYGALIERSSNDKILGKSETNIIPDKDEYTSCDKNDRIASDPLSSSQTDGVAETPPGDVDPEIEIDPPRSISKEDASSGNNEIQACQTVQTPLVVLGQEAYNNHENEAKSEDDIHRGQRDVMDRKFDYKIKESGVLLQPWNIQQEALTVAQAPENESKEDKTDRNVKEDVHEKYGTLIEKSSVEKILEKSETNIIPDKDEYTSCDTNDETPGVNKDNDRECKGKNEQSSIAEVDEEYVKGNDTFSHETDVTVSHETEVPTVKQTCTSSATDSITKPRPNQDAHKKPPCKDKEDDHCHGENHKFYRNKIVKGPGTTIEEMLKVNFDTLHANDVYWFWLFPVPKSDDITPNLSPDEAIAIKNDTLMHGRVLRAFKRALAFFGMEMVDETTKSIGRCQFKFMEVRYKNWQDIESRRIRNCNRITRILTSLGELGYEHLQCPFVEFLMTEVLINKSLNKISKESFGPWINAIKNEDTRKTLLHKMREKSSD